MPDPRVIKCVIAYDGTAYQGWQRQADGPTIQAAIETALEPMVGRPVTITGAGRTDAGVHALGQVASARLETTHDVAAIRRALNVRLPADIRILRVDEAPAAFHARFDAVGKTYRYRIVTSDVVMPSDRWFVWHHPGRWDAAAMREAATVLVGTHDFAAFQAAHSGVVETVRTISRLTVTPTDDGIVIEVSGDGFLRHMVRTIVGTLAEVGLGRRAPVWAGEVLASRRRDAAGDTAPAAGLTLVSVAYPPGC